MYCGVGLAMLVKKTLQGYECFSIPGQSDTDWLVIVFRDNRII